MDTATLTAEGISVSLDLGIGHIAEMLVESGGRQLRPLHRAPWAAEPVESLPGDLPEGTRRLSGDFLCAPFSASDVEPAPLHGWPANSRWVTVSSGATAGGWQARFRLEKKVLGATVEKLLTLRDGHPFLYQEHFLIGGQGKLPAAHHPMTAMRAGGRLSFSPKRLALTPDTALEPDASRGRYVLAYPAESETLTAFPRADGGVYDLTAYPAEGSAEDFVALIEAGHQGFGWTAIARHAETDLILVLKDPADLPVTMLWISNGGRDYAPWSGRHRGVLGIEDGRTALGHAASIGDNPLKQRGVATSFELQQDGVVSFRHVIGAVPLDDASEAPLSVTAGEGILHVGFAGARSLDIPFDSAFLGPPPRTADVI